MGGLITLLRTNQQLRRLWLAEVVSMAGDWLSFVAISLLALNSDSGAIALASVLVLHTLPTALFAPLAGLLADRLEARTAMTAGALLEAGLTVALLFAAHTESLLAVQVLVFVRASVTALVYPTYGVAMRQLVEDRDLVRANALNAGTWSVMFSVGMALGGLLSLLGPEVALTIDAMTFVLAAGILRGLPALVPVEAGTTTSVARAWRDGLGALPGALRHARADPVLLEATVAKASVAFTGAGVWLLIHLETGWLTGLGTAGLGTAGLGTAGLGTAGLGTAGLGTTGLGTSGLGLGLLHALRGVGTGVGPAATARWLGDGNPGVAVLRAGQVLTAAGLCAVALSPQPWLALVGVFVWGLGTGANWTLSSAVIQLRAPRAWLGRISALDGAARTTALSVAVLSAAWAVDGGVPARTVAVVTISAGAASWLAVLGGRFWAGER